MTPPVRGIVKNCLIVPDAPFPEGAQVEIHLFAPAPEVPPELPEELAAWQRLAILVRVRSLVMS
jgi:hypothetical protein